MSLRIASTFVLFSLLVPAARAAPNQCQKVCSANLVYGTAGCGLAAFFIPPPGNAAFFAGCVALEVVKYDTCVGNCSGGAGGGYSVKSASTTASYVGGGIVNLSAGRWSNGAFLTGAGTVTSVTFHLLDLDAIATDAGCADFDALPWSPIGAGTFDGHSMWTLPVDTSLLESAHGYLVRMDVDDAALPFTVLGHAALWRTDPAGALPPLRLNEIYSSHSGTDDQEFIELVGPAGASLAQVMVLVVEGDGASAGTLDRAYDLTGSTVPSDGFFVLGDALVAGADHVIGTSDSLENGTQTYYLLDAQDPAAVVALLGTDVSVGSTTTLVPGLGTVLDLVGVADGQWPSGTDTVFDGAEVLGPDGLLGVAGIYRGATAAEGWCGDGLDFDVVANQVHPRTPGAPNAPCHVVRYHAGCAGAGAFTPRLQMSGDSGAGGAMELSVYEGQGGAPAVLLVGSGATKVCLDGACDLVVGPTPLLPIVLTLGGVGAGAGSVTLPFVVPATVVSGTLFTQCLVAEGTSPLGFVVSNGVATTLHP